MHSLARIAVSLIVTGVLFTTIVQAQAPSPTPTRVQGETVFMDQEVLRLQVPAISNLPIIGNIQDFSRKYLIDYLAANLSQVRLTNDEIKLPKLSDYAMRFFGAATNPLTPNALQQQTIHATDNPKRKFYITGRLCIYDASGSLYDDTVISTRDIVTQSDNPENAIEFGEGAKFLGAAYGRGRVAPDPNGQYDYRKDELAIQTENPLPCDASLTTAATEAKSDASRDVNLFSYGSPVIPVSLQGLLAQLLYFGPSIFCNPNFRITLPPPIGTIGFQCNEFIVKYKGTTLNPWVANTHCNLDGCREGELTGVNYPVADEDRESGGLANTFRPQVLSYTNKLHGGDPAQSLDAAGRSIPGESALSFQGSLQDNSKGIMCSLLPKQLQTESCVFATTNQDCEAYFQNPKVEKTPGGGNGGFNPSMTYSIPYRNTACQIDASKVDQLANFAASWSNRPGTDKAKAAANVRQYWKTIQDYALQYEWNPAFIMALWIEESAAGGVPAWQMGCTYRYNQQSGSWTKLPQDSPTCEQLACLMAYPQQPPDDFYRFMCSYNTTAQIPGTNQCPPYPNWNFAQSIRLSYERISDILGLSSQCRIRTN